MRLACLLIVAAPLVGCSSSGEADAAPKSAGELSPLRSQLNFLLDAEAAQVEGLAAQLVAEGETPAQRRAGQLWKMAIIPELRESLNRADDQAALLHLWARNAQIEHYFVGGEGAERFGARAAAGGALFTQATQRLEGIAQTELGPERFPAARELVERYGEGAPLEVDPLNAAKNDKELDALLRDSLGKPLDVVMQPLRAINPGKGLSDTARAVKEFSAIVDEARRDLELMPELIRWQTELLMLDLDENRTRKEAQQSLAELSSTAAELGRTVQGLPAEVEQRATALLVELEARQGELRQTFEAARGTLAEGERVVVASQATATALTQTAQAIDAALVTFTRLNEQLSGPPRPADEPAPPPGKPFDIEDYTRTAQALTDSLTQLNHALEQVAELSAPDSSERLARLVDESVAAATRRVALTAAGLVLLAAVAFGLARRWSSR